MIDFDAIRQNFYQFIDIVQDVVDDIIDAAEEFVNDLSND